MLIKIFFCVVLVLDSMYIKIIESCFLICGLGSILIGSIGAFYQEKIKRLIAYSSINTIGFLLIGLSLMT